MTQSKIRRFVKRPVIIEAMQLPERFDRDKDVEFVEWINQTNWQRGFDDDLIIETTEGSIVVHPNEWIVRGEFGEFYKIREYILMATYLEVPTEEINLKA